MIQELHGKGTLLLDDEEVLAGEFKVSHDLNQSNGLVVRFQAAGSAAATFEERMASGEREDLERRLALDGETDDSIPVKIDQLLIGSRTLSKEEGNFLQIELTLIPRAPLAVDAPPKGASAFQFLCPNLLFNGLMRTAQADGGYKMDTVLVETKHYDKAVRFTLKQLPDYEEASAIVQQTTKSRWTATLRVETIDGSALEMEEAILLADNFLLILSFALSKRVTWVSLEASDDPGSFQRIRSGTVTNLKSFPGSVMGDGALVAGEKGRARQPMSEFMKVALPGYWSLDKLAQNYLREAIERMCESIERFFTPATVTLAGRSFESLCRGFLGKGDQCYLAEDYGANTVLRKALLAKLSEFGAMWRLKDRESAEEWSERLHGHIDYLLHRPLKLQLATLLDRYLKDTGNPYESSWKNQFVNARNNASHDSPVGRKEAVAWIKGITLLSQVILKILGYRGSYMSFYGDEMSESKWPVIN